MHTSIFYEFAKKAFFTGATVLLVWGSLLTPSAFAIPSLQLDILGGSYREEDETIVSNGPIFTLYALLIPNRWNQLSDTYYVSAAVVPEIGPPGADLGSFEFNGNTIDVTADMTYGVPPIELISSLQGWDSKDLPKHDVYPTYFSEFGFQFSSALTSAPYDTRDDAGAGPSGTGGMYYVAFNVDTSNLSSPYQIHFDLYNTKVKGVDTDITSKAPFSHDAESSPSRVPEPSTVLILGLGMLGLAFWERYNRKSEAKR